MAIMMPGPIEMIIIALLGLFLLVLPLAVVIIIVTMHTKKRKQGAQLEQKQ